MRRSDTSVIALLLACIAAIGLVDYVTGPDVGFSLFYLVPIVWSGWYINRTASVALALTAAASWISAEVAWHGMTPVSMWNGFTRIGIFVAMAWLTSRLRVEQYQLHEANAKLQ